MHSLTIRKQHPSREIRLYCDEAGRGPLAGPVTVGCAMQIEKTTRTGFQDSKQLTKKQRNQAYENIIGLHTQGSVLTSTGRSSAQEIDQHGIIYAINLACRRGLGALCKQYYNHLLRNQLLTSDLGEDHVCIQEYDRLFAKPLDEDTIGTFLALPNSQARIASLLRDGNHRFGLDKVLSIPITTIIKGDQKIPLISIASIVAKVERDRYMEQISDHYPVYKFSKHKGYGTKVHRDAISANGPSHLHRITFCKKLLTTEHMQTHPQATNNKQQSDNKQPPKTFYNSTISSNLPISLEKPKLLLHICCAPDLTRPLHRLKQYFRLYLFRYNPNIHPRQEHTKRYEQFIKLIGLQDGDYEIVEDRYDPKEFFQAMIDQKVSINPALHNASDKEVLKTAGAMEERSERCNPCYALRLETAARMADRLHIPYFTSTLLISPKKIMEKLYRWGKEVEEKYTTTKFLWFDFAKNGGYEKAVHLTKQHDLYRQYYCGCGWTVPKSGQPNKRYHGG